MWWKRVWLGKMMKGMRPHRMMGKETGRAVFTSNHIIFQHATYSNIFKSRVQEKEEDGGMIVTSPGSQSNGG